MKIKTIHVMIHHRFKNGKCHRVADVFLKRCFLGPQAIDEITQ